METVQRHAASAGIGGLLTRLSGLIREVVFAGVFGAGVHTDAFIAAQRVPNLFRDLVAEGSMASAFVPTLTSTEQTRGREAAWLLANAFLGLSLTFTGLLTLVMMVFAPQFVWLVASGFTDDPIKLELTIQLIRLMAPFLAMINLASAFGAMLTIRRQFFLPMLAPAAFNLAVIAGVFLAHRLTLLGEPIYLVGLAATLGGALQCAVQYPALKREGFTLRPHLRGHPDLGKLLRFLLPALIGISAVQAGVLIDLQIASTLGDGPASWLNYAFRIVQLPMTLFAGAAGVASLALLADSIAGERTQEAKQTLEHALNFTAFFVWPSAVLIGLFAHPIVQLLFERGAFQATDTQMTAALLVFYASGIIAFSAHRILTPALFAWQDPVSPMILTILAVVFKLPLAILLTYYTPLGLWGIPVAHVLVANLEALGLGVVLFRKCGPPSKTFWRENAQMVGSIAIVALLLLVLPLPKENTFLSLLLLGMSGALYITLTHLFGLPYAQQALARIKRRPSRPE
jgi:putative peptidoglycan lipid II flippase